MNVSERCNSVNLTGTKRLIFYQVQNSKMFLKDANLVTQKVRVCLVLIGSENPKMCLEGADYVCCVPNVWQSINCTAFILFILKVFY